jgi:DNA-binding NarL/FixJ family response regulator
MLSILVVDDHELVRMSLREMLEEHPGWLVCGEAANGLEAVGKALTLNPDVAILDLKMPELGGLEATRRIRLAAPRTEVLILTGFESDQLAADATAAGAHGLVLKGGEAGEVIRAIEALEQHRVYPHRDRSPRESGAGQDLAAPRARRLTPRELEIAQLLAEGKTNWIIGVILGISVKTVETHRANILGKLGLESVVELVRYAVRTQLIEL